MNRHIYYSEKDSLDLIPKKDLSFGESYYITWMNWHSEQLILFNKPYLYKELFKNITNN